MSKEKLPSRESKEVKNLPLSVVEDYFRKINEYENLTSEKRTIMEQYYGWEKMPGRNEKIMENFKKQWDEIENQLNSLRKSLDNMREKNPALLDAERYFNLYQEYYRLIDEIKKLRDERDEMVLKEAQISKIRTDEAEEKLRKESPSHPYKILSEKIKEMDKRKDEVRAEAENIKKVLPDDVVKRLDSNIVSRIQKTAKKEKEESLQINQEKVVSIESQQNERIVQDEQQLKEQIPNLSLDVATVGRYIEEIEEYRRLAKKRANIMDKYELAEKIPSPNYKQNAERWKRELNSIDNEMERLQKVLNQLREKNPALLDAERYFHQKREFIRLGKEILRLSKEVNKIALDKAQKDSITLEKAMEKLREESPPYYKDLLEKIIELNKKRAEILYELEDLKEILSDKVVDLLEYKISETVRKEEEQTLKEDQKEEVVSSEFWQNEGVVKEKKKTFNWNIDLKDFLKKLGIEISEEFENQLTQFEEERIKKIKERLREEQKIKEQLAQIKDINQIEEIIKNEYVKIFEDFKQKGYTINEDLTFNPDFCRAVAENLVIELARDRYNKLTGVFNNYKLLQLEDEVLKQISKKTDRGIETKIDKDTAENPIEKLRKEIENFQIEVLSDKEAEEILSKAKITGDPYKGEFLTKDILKEEGLMPRYKIRVGDVSIWFSSNPYELSGGRIAVVGYVEKDGEIFARSYYLSNSQGIWRYLPDYKTDENGNISWYGKGYSEESITLPIMAQKALSEIIKKSPVLRLKRDPNLIFAGLSKNFESIIMGNKSDYLEEIDEQPIRLKGKFYDREKIVSPEQIFLSEEETPDFSKLLTTWEQETSLYGKITIEVFPSKDGKLLFMFCRDELDRVWIGGIDNNSEITSTGLRKSWVDGGFLTMPAFEYQSQSYGYGNADLMKRNYIDMYANYISKIPVIREYNKQYEIRILKEWKEYKKRFKRF